jgi:NTE family protein
MKKYKNWKGKKYYIESQPDENKMFNFLLGISDKTILDIGQIFSFENILPKRMLFEFIIPRIADLLNLSKESSYQDIVISLCEEIAIDIPLDKFKLYTFQDFVKAITENYSPKKGKTQNIIPSFMKQNEIISHFVRDIIFEEIASKMIK